MKRLESKYENMIDWCRNETETGVTIVDASLSLDEVIRSVKSTVCQVIQAHTADTHYLCLFDVQVVIASCMCLTVIALVSALYIIE